jgi:hypothetical protein
MSEDITNLKVSTGKIETKIDNLTKLLESHILEENENKKSHEIILSTKADKKEVNKIQGNLERVVWIVLTAVMGSILGLIFIK